MRNGICPLLSAPVCSCPLLSAPVRSIQLQLAEIVEIIGPGLRSHGPHNPKVPSSNLGPATIFPGTYSARGPISTFLIQNEERTRNRATRQRPPAAKVCT
jgi:hypothetical protein